MGRLPANEEQARILQEWEAAKASFTGPVTKCKPGKGLAPPPKTARISELSRQEVEISPQDNDEGRLRGKPRFTGDNAPDNDEGPTTGEVSVSNAHADRFEIWEDRRTTGFVKSGGKHTQATGLVSRRGYKRIVPDADSWMEEQGADVAQELIEVAGKILHGRNATVFEGRVLAPLQGKPRRSVDDLAKQFNVRAARIYKIVDDCKRKIERALAKPPEDVALYRGILNGDNPQAWETCAVCGREYIWNVLPTRIDVCGARRGSAEKPSDD